MTETTALQDTLASILVAVTSDPTGEVASYIPELACVNPDKSWDARHDGGWRDLLLTSEPWADRFKIRFQGSVKRFGGV